MSGVRYTDVLSIALLHQYYVDGQCQLMTIYPDAQTLSWLKQFGGVFRQEGSIARLLLPDTVDLKAESEAAPSFYLQWNCVSEDEGFVRFTDMPFAELGQLVFSDRALLYPDQTDIELESQFVAQPGGVTQIARIEISLAKLAAARKDKSLSYKVQFKSRQLQWRYFFVPSKEETLGQLKLKGAGSDQFVEQGIVQLPDQTLAHVWSSAANKIIIQQRGPLDLKLYTMKPGGEELLIEHLPNASPYGLQQSTEEAVIYSAIYVYV